MDLKLLTLLCLFVPLQLVSLPARAQQAPPEEAETTAAADATAESDAGAANAEATSGVPVEVTLYRDSALVTRLIELEAGKGPREVTVDDLPEALISSSVFAEGNESLAVRAVRVVESPIAESTREEVRELNQALQVVQEKIAQADHSIEVTRGNLATLEEMIQFTSAASTSDLNRGLLDATTLTELVQFSMQQRKQLSDEIEQIAQTKKQLAADEQLLQRRVAEVTSGSPQTRYQSKVFVELLDDQPSSLRLSYAVTGCGWSPQYTLSGKIDSDQFRLRYGALVQQLSGEPWNNVRLTLSTASPSVSAAGPTLAPLRITAVDTGQTSSDDPFGGVQMEPQAAHPSQTSLAPESVQSPLSGKIQSLRRKQSQVERIEFQNKDARSSTTRDIALNSLAGEIQELELQAAAKTARSLASDVHDEVASQTYELAQPVSLDTRREQQLVEIVDAELTGELYHVATPLLSSFAYREADLENTLSIGLLGGTAAIYLDDRFVGNMTIPTTASGQRLLVGFGADGQVRTRRELVNKQETVQGGNRRLEFEYRLVVSNFKDTPVTLRVLDRIPITDQSQQISVTLAPTEVPMSEDKLYERVLRPLGILRWDVDLPASRFGSDAFDIDYSYTIEFDRSRSLAVPGAAEQAERDLHDMSLPAQMGGGMGGSMGGGTP